MATTVSFQGEFGAFSEQAAYAYFGKGCKPVPCLQFRQVFENVRKKRTDTGIIPIENSLFGSVHQNFDLLQEFPLHIVGEVKLRIRMNLMALKTTALSNVLNVYSHPQALGQCDPYLRTLKNITLHQYYDTAGAAKMIAARKLTTAAAVASVQAAKHYHLKILKKGIETDRRNYTRFIVLSRTPASPEGKTKTSVIFATHHVPGSLTKCLAAFSDNNVNLLKIESRPFVGKPWEYLFFADVQADRNDPRFVSSLKKLRTLATTIKILGSYEIGRMVS